jgi:hypothetical protein
VTSMGQPPDVRKAVRQLRSRPLVEALHIWLQETAIALAVVATKGIRRISGRPRGYFHGMVTKAKAGELNLDRTLWAMRRAAEPTPRPKTAGSEDCAARRAPLWD